ncbi:MAG: alcohol dehydrogenase catalytic domain-containing protein, partial [Oleiphilaceae bacterium]|nr:alcohol dehydrogenase catalytic domain-containing protein [Oleiphilaceae bacterium]
MRAVAYQRSLPADHPESLCDHVLPEPQPGPRDLLVAVKAIAVNPVDTKIRMRVQPDAGQYKVLGWDAAGEVVAVGTEVRDFVVGDAVYYAGDLNRQGSNAEYQCVDYRLVAKKPASLSFAEAAALPLTSLTAWEMLFDRLQIPLKENTAGPAALLITAGAGGVGSIALQLARELTHCRLFATASRPDSQAWAKDMG